MVRFEVSSPSTAPPTARLRIDAGTIGKLEGGLLAPAGSSITDGTSNTIMFTTSRGSVQSVPAIASRAWSQPQALRSGFGLLLPAVAGFRFQKGSVLPTVILLPYIEQENVYRAHGIQLERVRVTSVVPTRGDTAIWLEPSGIIAILIGL